MEYLIDVIIPLYNRTEYVDDLIGNLEKQNMRKFRAIFVDDGSTDGTYELLFEKLESVSFPHVLLKKENGGAASARNMGLKHADAPWVGFIDSDDIAQPEYLEYLYKAATEAEADLAVCSFGEISSMEDAAKHQAGELEYKVISPAECMKNYCTSWLGVYCLLIKQSLVRDNELYFDEECRYCEDAPYIAEVIIASSRVAMIENELYLYYTNQGSLSRSGSVEKFISGIRSFESTVNALENSENEAAKIFTGMGCARYFVAVLRKAAVQLPYSEFSKLEKYVPLKRYKKQLDCLTKTQATAAKTYLISGRMFYAIIRALFKD